MAQEMDLRILATINCKNSMSFHVIADESGFFIFDDIRQAFTFVFFETGKYTEFSLKNSYENFSLMSTVFYEKNVDNSNITDFFGFGTKNQTNTHFCALFSANMQDKIVNIVDDCYVIYTSYFALNNSSIYKSKNGQIFVFNADSKKINLSVSQILLNESRKIEYKTVAHYENLVDPPYHLSLFVEDEALFYFSNNDKTKLIKLPLNTTLPASVISLSQLANLIETEVFTGAPVYFNGNVFFSAICDERATSIWSLNTQSFCLSLREKIRHHHRAKWTTKELDILPDGSAFLLIICEDCAETSHVHQFDLSACSDFDVVVNPNELGRGGFGTVHEGRLDGQQVAIKILHDLSMTPAERRRHILLSAVTEARKLKMLHHTNIIKGYGFKIEEKKFMVFMELMYSSVRQKILRTYEKRLEEKVVFRILQQTLEGLVYLHTLKPKPIVHRDIKCANILLDENEIIKIGDMGLIKAVNLNTAGTTDLALASTENAGTVYWQAPEVLEADSAKGRKADVWSIGCSIVEMLTGYPPYCHCHQPTQWAVLLSRGKLTYNPRELVPSASQDVHYVLEKCFRKQTKMQPIVVGVRDEPIRPHSMEILSDVIDINEFAKEKEDIKLANDILTQNHYAV